MSGDDARAMLDQAAKMVDADGGRTTAAVAWLVECVADDESEGADRLRRLWLAEAGRRALVDHYKALHGSAPSEGRQVPTARGVKRRRDDGTIEQLRIDLSVASRDDLDEMAREAAGNLIHARAVLALLRRLTGLLDRHGVDDVPAALLAEGTTFAEFVERVS